jgi:hypothetical protein
VFGSAISQLFPALSPPLVHARVSPDAPGAVTRVRAAVERDGEARWAPEDPLWGVAAVHRVGVPSSGVVAVWGILVARPVPDGDPVSGVAAFLVSQTPTTCPAWVAVETLREVLARRVAADHSWRSGPPVMSWISFVA